MCFIHTTRTPKFADDFVFFQAPELEQRMERQQAERKVAAPEVATFKTSMYLFATFKVPLGTQSAFSRPHGPQRGISPCSRFSKVSKPCDFRALFRMSCSEQRWHLGRDHRIQKQTPGHPHRRLQQHRF